MQWINASNNLYHVFIFNLPIGGAWGSCPISGPRIVSAPGGSPEAAQVFQGPGQWVLQAQSSERRQPVSPGVPGSAAPAQWQHEDAGGLVWASAPGAAEEEAGWRKRSEDEQGASNGPEGQTGTPERQRTETGGAEVLPGTKDQLHRGRAWRECHTTQGMVTAWSLIRQSRKLNECWHVSLRRLWRDWRRLWGNYKWSLRFKDSIRKIWRTTMTNFHKSWRLSGIRKYSQSFKSQI